MTSWRGSESLSRSLNRQLDEKRQDWQRQAQRLQRDFFKVWSNPSSFCLTQQHLQRLPLRHFTSGCWCANVI